jgi:hypothetical protein
LHEFAVPDPAEKADDDHAGDVPEFPAGGLALMAGGFRAPAGGPRRASQRGRQPAPTRVVEWQWRPGDVVRWRDYEGKMRRVDAEHAFVEINGSCSG